MNRIIAVIAIYISISEIYFSQLNRLCLSQNARAYLSLCELFSQYIPTPLEELKALVKDFDHLLG